MGLGAVLINLAEKGYDVEGTDLSNGMINVAKKKAKKKGLNLNIFPANMAELKCDRKYSLAIIARGGFMNLLTPQLQRKALLSIKEVLCPGGILTLNTFCPDVSMQYKSLNKPNDEFEFSFEYSNSEGNKERVYTSNSYNQENQVTTEIWKIETVDKNGNIINTRKRNFYLRQTYKMEMEYLIELCGYKIINVYGDYYKHPATNRALIWVLQKK